MQISRFYSGLSIYRKLFVVLFTYSIFILWLSTSLGLHKSNGFIGYLHRPNWYFYPLYWTVVIPFIHLTWHEFIKSWRSLFNNGLIEKEGDAGSKVIADDFEREIVHLRKYLLIPVAIVLATIVMAIDTNELRTIYQIPISTPEQQEVKGNTHDSESNQLATADKENQVKNKKQKLDWSNAWLVHPENKRKKLENAIFVVLAYIQQYIIIFFGFLCLLQIWCHVFVFHKPELMKSFKGYGLTLSLDPYSKLREFGLERWNQAINSVYWWLSIILLVPITSRASQTSGDVTVGQVMINWLVPLLFLSPMLFTIAARQKKLVMVWNKVRVEEDDGKIDLYHKQLLWPLDKNWASKLGIVISFTLLSYLVGDILKNISKISL